MISEECSDTVVGLDMLVGLSTGLRCSLKRFLIRRFVSPIVFEIAFALNHVNKDFRVIDF